MKEKEPVQYRIGLASAVALIMIAAFFDILTAIPFIGTILDMIFWLGMGAYFWVIGIGFFDGKKLATSAISFIIELFPGIQSLPALTAGIIAIILITRIEDKTGRSVMHPLKKGVTPPRFERKPLNTGDTREARKTKPENIIKPSDDSDELEQAA